MEHVDVMIIGAGATGAGVARDLALRGVDVALVDKADVADGTSGRNHGLLHSGGRYAVKDPEAAAECIRENIVLKRVAAHCIDDCGGMFAAMEGDDPAYADRFEEACKVAGIEAERVGAREASGREPGLNDRVREAFLVPDAAVDPFFLCLANCVDAAEHGAKILTHHAVREVRTDSGAVTGLVLEDTLTGQRTGYGCRLVVNAAGPWAGKVADLAGLEVDLVLSRGALVVTRGRLVRGVVNRLRPPSDGDIIVPGGPVCLVGTTSVTVPTPEDLVPGADEADHLIAQGCELVPMLHAARIIREFTGIRPLYQEGAGKGDGRAVSRGFAVLDHEARDGLAGMITVVGGKLTTYRLMAEKVADMASAKLGVEKACSTAEEILPGSEDVEEAAWPQSMPGWEARALVLRHGSRALKIVEKDLAAGLTRTCVCETVPEAEVRFATRKLFARTLDDLRRRTRLGMGPCQGSTCAPRAAALMADELGLDPERASSLLREFLLERRKGRLAVMGHGGAAQEELIRCAERGFEVEEVKP
jgi:glycerol-3-phosphate dehydrogenase